MSLTNNIMNMYLIIKQANQSNINLETMLQNSNFIPL